MDKRMLLVIGTFMFLVVMLYQTFLLQPSTHKHRDSYSGQPILEDSGTIADSERILTKEELVEVESATHFDVEEPAENFFDGPLAPIIEDIIPENDSEGDAELVILPEQAAEGENMGGDITIPSEEFDLINIPVEDGSSHSNVSVSSSVSLPSFAGGWTPTSFPIGVVAYNRPDYLRKALNSLLHDVQFAVPDLVTVYQDGHDAAVKAVSSEYPGVHWVNHDRTALWEGAANIARHYGYVLGHLFLHHPEAKYVIVAEDDMIFSPDFLLYFAQLANVMDNDMSVWCISSWNDNGFSVHARDPRELLRTDFFIGLGWLVPRRIWEEVGPRWPQTHWDHWMRSSEIRKGRQCIFPEVNRNYNIGVQGTHSDQKLFDQYFLDIKLQDAPAVDLGDTGRLVADRYRADLEARISVAQQVHSFSDLAVKSSSKDLVMFITIGSEMDENSWSQISAYFKLWHSTPIRGMYLGTHQFWHRDNKLILIAPFSPFMRYKSSGTPSFHSSQFVNR